MRSLLTLPTLFVFMALMGGCGSAGDQGGEAAPEAEAEPGSAMSAEELGQDMSCWLRGATPEEAMERPSPLGETEFSLEGNVGKVCYGRPSARDRQVEGGLIPFGETWRLGANEATAIILPFPARIGGVELQPGTYSIFAIPGEFEWEFVINSNAQRWGIPIDDAVRATDVGSFTGLPRAMTEPVEQFTIRWHTHDDHDGHLVLEWGRTRVEFEVALLEHSH
jgi:hypothetical protein